MFKLKLTIDQISSVFQSSSQQRMIREVIDLFSLKGNDRTRIPFSGYLNESGQIVEMTIENNPDDAWWRENYPLRHDKQVKVVGSITKISSFEAEDGYPVPKDLLKGDGNCWVAIKDGEVVDVIYMRIGKDADFAAFRKDCLEILRPKGTPINGEITSKRFYPRAARKIKRN